MQSNLGDQYLSDYREKNDKQNSFSLQMTSCIKKPVTLDLLSYIQWYIVPILQLIIVLLLDEFKLNLPVTI